MLKEYFCKSFAIQNLKLTCAENIKPCEPSDDRIKLIAVLNGTSNLYFTLNDVSEILKIICT